MSDTKVLFRAALKRRAYLLGACLYACNTALVAAAAGNVAHLFRLQIVPFLQSLLRTALWMLPAHLALISVLFFFFLETVCTDNPLYASRNAMQAILTPLVAGPIWGYCLYQAFSGANAPYAVPRAGPLSLLAGALAVGVFCLRRRVEQRHHYVIDATPAVISKIWKRFCLLIPVALRDTCCVVLSLYLAEAAGGALQTGCDLLGGTIRGVSAGADLVGPSPVALINNVLAAVRVVAKIFLSLSSSCCNILKCLVALMTSLVHLGNIAAAYHCALTFMTLYLVLSLAEEAMRVVVFHPMKFSRLRAVAAAASSADSSLLGNALSSILPAKVPSVQALLSRDLDSEVELSSTRVGRQFGIQRHNVKVNCEAVSQSSRRPHLWLETLMAQLDVADAMLKAVKPSPFATCPVVPALTAPSSAMRGLSNGWSSFADFDDAVHVLMQALAAHDFSRSARGLHSLDCFGSVGLPRSGFISQHQRDLLESELEALPLASKDWCKVAVSSCAVIDATALQFTLASAFIEDELSRNNMILFDSSRMSEKQLLQSIFEIVSAFIPISAYAKAALSTLKAFFLRKKVASSTSSSTSSSGSQDTDIHLIKKGVSLPVIVSQEPSVNAGPGNDGNRLENRIKVASFVATQLIDKGRAMRATSFFDQLKHVWYSYFLRNEINKSGILDLLISSVIGQSRSRALLESIKTRNVPISPVPVVVIQTCAHTIEALTIIMGLELQSNKYATVSSHVASSVTSLLGLQLAMKRHRDVYRKYVARHHGFQSGSRGATGGKEFFSQNEGGVVVAQTPWVTADIQALSMSLDDAFARMLSKYGDIIPSYSYPASYLGELKIRLMEQEY